MVEASVNGGKSVRGGGNNSVREIARMQAELSKVEHVLLDDKTIPHLDGEDARGHYAHDRARILSAIGTMDSVKHIEKGVSAGVRETLSEAVILLNPDHPNHGSQMIVAADSKAYGAYKAALEGEGIDKGAIIKGLQTVEKSLQQGTEQARSH